MWRTSTGDRILLGDEARIFLDAVRSLRDMITSGVDFGESYQTGVTLFDSLQPTQQMMALHAVATSLLKQEVPMPELSATLEATVYAIYREIGSLIEMEISFSDDYVSHSIRSGVIAACRWRVEVEGNWADLEEDNDLPACECNDIEQWKPVIESLADRVLWDRDFELESLLADKDPAQTSAIKTYLGIADDYFAIAAPDAQSEEFRRIDHELVSLRVISPR